MKWYFILIIWTGLLACTKTNRTEITNLKADFIEDNNYISPLPIDTSEDKIKSTNCIAIPDSMRSLFHTLKENTPEACMMRFPDEKGFKVIAVNYTDSLETKTVLYTSDSGWKIYDYLQVQSTEVLKPYSLQITQSYSIDTEYRIKEKKYLKDLLIEELTYIITDKGEFSELRDGNIQSTAYEMFTNTDQFVVETFIWETTPEGNLIKKNSRQQTYNLKDFTK